MMMNFDRSRVPLTIATLLLIALLPQSAPR